MLFFNEPNKEFAMKMPTQTLRCLFFALATFSPHVFAYDAAEPAETALSRLRDTDCSTQSEECKYFSAVEMESLIDVCPVVFRELFGPDADSDIAFSGTLGQNPDDFSEYRNRGWPVSNAAPVKARLWFQRWIAQQPVAMQNAALAPHNSLRSWLDMTSHDYFMGLRRDPRLLASALNDACGRVGMAQNGADPEKLSDLLNEAKNRKTKREKTAVDARAAAAPENH